MCVLELETQVSSLTNEIREFPECVEREFSRSFALQNISAIKSDKR